MAGLNDTREENSVQGDMRIFKVMRYELISFDRIAADKSQRVTPATDNYRIELTFKMKIKGDSPIDVQLLQVINSF